MDPEVFQRVRAAAAATAVPAGPWHAEQARCACSRGCCTAALRAARWPTPTRPKRQRRTATTSALNAPRNAAGTLVPSKSVPAAEIERFVVEQIRCIGRDKGLIDATLAEKQAEERDRGEIETREGGQCTGKLTDATTPKREAARASGFAGT